MHVVPRIAVAVLAGLAAAATLAVPMAGRADAATSTVWIVQKQQTTHGPVETALRTTAGNFASTSLVTGGTPAPGQKWVRRDSTFGNGLASYESVRFPGRCLEVERQFTGARVTLASCDGGADQLWKSSGSFREFRNIFSNKAATFAPSQPGNITDNVVVTPFTGTNNQLWEVRTL